MTPLEEIDALLTGVAMGDRRAFRKLYARCAPLVHAALLRQTKSEDRAEERLEDGFAAIWQTAGAFRDGDDSLGWIAAQAGLSKPLGPGAAQSAPPPQVQHRLEARLWGTAETKDIWRQLRPYLIGAIAAALVAWIAVQTGLIETQ